MKSIFAFIVGLLLTVEAQVMLPHRHSISHPRVTNWTPQSLTNIRYYWVASDATNVGNATNWPERIVGLDAILESGTGPTNSTNGLHFTAASSTKMRSKNLYTWLVTSGSTGTFWCVIMPAANAADGLRGIVGDWNAGAYTGLRTTNGNKISWNGYQEGELFTYTPDTMIDFGFISDINHTNIYYTNGVAFSTNLLGTYGEYGYFGTLNVANTYYNGYIAEIAYFDGLLSASDFVFLHTYATNTYKFSP